MTSPANDLTPPRPKPYRAIVRAFSLILLLPALALFVFMFTTPITISGLGYVVGGIAVCIGLWGAAWGHRRVRWLLAVGAALIVGIMVMRLLALNTDSGRIKLLTLPEQNSFCLMNCIFDEQDVSLFSTRILSIIGWVSPDENVGLIDAMVAGYAGMAADQPQTASPFVRTYTGQERSGAFDAVVVEPEDNFPTQTGIIFLHGFTGNFTMPCWLVSQAVRARHFLTVCPSVGWEGHWWTADGEATLRATIDYLHGRGVNKIYLAGLSNGAVGASELAYKLTDDIAGLILINGASSNARDSGLSVLVLAGRYDQRMPAAMLRSYAERMGDHATYVELDGDHFMLAKHADPIQSSIDSWLGEH